MINLGAETFSNCQNAEGTLTKPRKAEATRAKTTNATTNQKISDWFKRII